MKVLIGTTNPSKVKRFEKLLKDRDVTFCTLKDLDITGEPDEAGSTPEENAIIKAKYYGRYFDYVICNDSGLYFEELPLNDERQPGLNIRTPQGVRLDDEEMIAYYSELVHSLGGKVLAYYLDGIAVYNKGQVFSFMENSEATKASAFYMVDEASPLRHPGWPLDSISVNKNTGTRFVEKGDNKYDTTKENIMLGEYRKRLVNFLTEALGLEQLILDITDFGAVGNGEYVCTKEIQRAIDLCPKNGCVRIPAGVFVSGALYLKSNMTLHLEEGAKLLGSSNVEDFPIKGYPYEGLDQLCYASLINTDGAPYENITISGKGVIDANGKALFEVELKDPRVKRGRTACIRNTRNLIIRDVTFRQSPAWCLHTIYCDGILMEGVQVHSKYDENGEKYGMHNCDGMDIDSCQNVVIRNCLIASQDDCIAVKSGRDAEGRRVGIPSKNILIENCKFISGFGVAMGSEMSGGVEDVYVRNCVFEDTFSLASVKAIRGRGNYVRNIHYENCKHKNSSLEHKDTRWFRGAIYLDGFYGAAEFDADKEEPVDDGTPIIEDIYFKDLEVETVAGNAIYLYGLPERHYRNIYMENVKAHGKYGMKVKNIDNLQLKNVQVTCDEGETESLRVLR